MTKAEGDRVPDVTFRIRKDGEMVKLTTAEVFANKKVVLFALPGAFTPTCSSAHVPRYNELAPAFQAAAVDSIVCLAVNDPFVMAEWAASQHADHVQFLSDGNGEFTEQMGMLVDKADLSFGKRSWRYSALVENGVITKLFSEPDKPGDPYEVSDADTMLRHLAPDAKPPHDIVLFTKPGCSHCARAKQLLGDQGWIYDELPSTPRRLRALSGRATTPQVFIDGTYIGGADELAHYLAAQ